jgi:hypothetical protein
MTTLIDGIFGEVLEISNDGVVLVCADQLLQTPFDGGVTGLSGWHNGIRDMGVFQPSFHDQRKGTRACSPLTGSSEEVKQETVGLVSFVPTKK